MTLVLGVDFGTLSVRVSDFDHQAGKVSSGNPYSCDLTGRLPALRKLAAVA